jgi:protein-S-isoprenylcysteine O-methyltransferase Ste14
VTLGRLFGIAYGLVCYAAFLAVSAYAFGFVGNYWALLGWKGEWFRSLDVGVSAPVVEAIGVDVLLIAFFGVQHSVMARRSFKAWWARLVPPALERSTYVLASSACLALIFWQWRPIGVVLYDVTNGAFGFAVVAVSLVGWLIAVGSTFLIDHAGLFGLRQVFQAQGKEPRADVEFQTPGLYRTVRHPLYLGFLTAFWATTVMTVGHLLFALGFTLYVLVAIPLEERDLAARFGEKYRDYQKRVRALLPFPRSG